MQTITVRVARGGGRHLSRTQVAAPLPLLRTPLPRTPTQHRTLTLPCVCFPRCASAGYRDDDDGILENLEATAKRERLASLAAEWEVEQARRMAVDPEGVSAEERDLAGLEGADGASFVAHVAVPDQAAIKEAVLARRKEELLAKLAASSADGGAEAFAGPAPRVEQLSSLSRLPPSW
jgi:hypothetical protein